MSDLDLTRYEGHTPEPWWLVPEESPIIVHGDSNDTLVCSLNAPWSNFSALADARLIADAPLLLAEVRRLGEAIRVQANAVRVIDQKERAEYVATATLDSHREANALLTAEIEALRQSHARLLTALLLVGRVEKRGGVPYYNTSGITLIHQDQMREIGAAVAEAEAL